MDLRKAVVSGILILLAGISFSQDPELSGFVRAGAYAGSNPENDKIYVPSAFSDLFVRAGYSAGEKFGAFADIQYRYGTEFSETVNNILLREGYVKWSGKKWDISAGQKIIRWGRADFINPTSKLTPRNLLLRSPDKEEINLGNLLAEVNVFPTERIRLQAIAVPLYRPSLLNIEPVPLPSYVSIAMIDGFITEDAFSYGIKADFYLKGIDLGISWFQGPDPMPGIGIARFEIRNAGGFLLPSIDLVAKPYRNRMAGIDFEAISGAFGFRGEAAWSSPERDQHGEYVPLTSFDVVAGADWSAGNWRVAAEYFGRYNCDHTDATVDPLIGTEPDLSEIAQLLEIPGFDIEDYMRQQVNTFNRLYNYQLEKLYHSAGLRIEADLAFGRIIPSLFSMYNFVSRELLLMPELRFKPADGFTIAAGAELYNGRKGSLYRIIDDFMNGIYISLRADF
jgi:hypothetical protein